MSVSDGKATTSDSLTVAAVAKSPSAPILTQDIASGISNQELSDGFAVSVLTAGSGVKVGDEVRIYSTVSGVTTLLGAKEIASTAELQAVSVRLNVASQSSFTTEGQKVLTAKIASNVAASGQTAVLVESVSSSAAIVLVD
jgi:hypothetical protein